MGQYSIRDLEYLSGIKAHTLRIWELRYNILRPKRTTTNIRYYDDSDLRSLLNISFLNQNGYKISKISNFSSDEILQLVEKIASTAADYATQITALVLAMVNLDEKRFQQVIQIQTEIEGFEKTALNIIFPFLERVGILWQTGEVNPAQEHFISGLIRQKILAGIDSLPPVTDKSAKSFLFFLPEGEWHEIGLLFAYLLVKSRNFQCMYLGQSLPFNDLCNTVKVYQPKYLVTSITNYPNQQKLVEYLELLCMSLPDTQVLVSGRQVLTQIEQLPKTALILKNMEELLALLSEISLQGQGLAP